VHEHPLVVPRRQPARAAEQLVVAVAPIARQEVDGAVVEEQERRVEARDDQILVVAGGRR
jgi:hypothetical protein